MDKAWFKDVFRRIRKVSVLIVLAAIVLSAPAGAATVKKVKYVKGKTVQGAVVSNSKVPVSSGGKFKKVGTKYRYVYPDGTKAVSFTYVFSDWYKGDQIGASLFDTDDLSN